MTGDQPQWSWQDRPEPVSAVAARARARSRMRMVTLAAGAAGLAAAGVVAYQLPGPKHTASGSPAAPASTPASSAPALSLRGDDGGGGDRSRSVSGGDDGSRSVSAGQPAPASAPGRAAHATSGGS